MTQVDAVTGTTIGVKSDSNTIVAINLLSNMDIAYLLKEMTKEHPSLKSEVEELNKKLFKHHSTICFKSNIGKEIFFSNNIIEKKY